MEEDEVSRGGEKLWHKGLTDKQRRFVGEYIVDRNGAAAARRADYDESNARHQAHENRIKPHIRAAIDAYLDVLHTSMIVKVMPD